MKTNKTGEQDDLFTNPAAKEKGGTAVNFRGPTQHILDKTHEAAIAAYGAVTKAQTARFLMTLGWASVCPSAPETLPPTEPSSSAEPKMSFRQKRDASLDSTADALKTLLAMKGGAYNTHVLDPALRRVLGKDANMREVGARMSQLANGEHSVDGIRVQSLGSMPVGSDSKGREAYRVSKS